MFCPCSLLFSALLSLILPLPLQTLNLFSPTALLARQTLNPCPAPPTPLSSFAAIMDFFASGTPVVNDGVDDHAGGLNSDTYINDDDTEVVAMVKEVRLPAVGVFPCACCIFPYSALRCITCASHRIASHRIPSHRIASPPNSRTAGAHARRFVLPRTRRVPHRNQPP